MITLLNDLTIKDGIAKWQNTVLRYSTEITIDNKSISFGKLLYDKDLLPSVYLQDIKVTGVTMPDNNGIDRQAELAILKENNKIVWIEPDPSNMYDKTAVKVMSDNKCLGYIPRSSGLKDNIFFSPERYVVYGFSVIGGTEDKNYGLVLDIGQLK